ncbi:methyltransferase domain-containing protein [Aureimonas fodinaquatilis]|uniref:Methyltransferase domain-containing protein n=1 Tax=Aureimonas fodinaquatilis TaxID=2565783 RepID=A0A5B0DZ03_9HYPH|nr:methyltransferase domain-containing protein [Aureimonas fodinaquatilis]KAA0971618.1 methyltransferase domain-containing protein [Aureimonas fodinaquatilis]
MTDHTTAPFDRDLQSAFRNRWRQRGMQNARFLFDRVTDELAERLSLVQRQFAIGAEISGLDGTLFRQVMTSGQVQRLVRVERGIDWLQSANEAVVADDELLPFADASLNLVIAPLSLHLTNDTPGSFIQIHRALKPDGLFLAALAGGETLTELRTSLLTAEAELSGGASPRVQPFMEIRDAGALLQRARFALPVIDQERLVVRYDTMFHLMAEIRAMGMANSLNARSRKPTTRGLFVRAAEIYAERFSDPDGRIRATFDIIYLSGWRAHESQQKPLRPGSAKASLAEALKDRSDKS